MLLEYIEPGLMNIWLARHILILWFIILLGYISSVVFNNDAKHFPQHVFKTRNIYTRDDRGLKVNHTRLAEAWHVGLYGKISEGHRAMNGMIRCERVNIFGEWWPSVICLHFFLPSERKPESEKQTDRQTDRQTDIQTCRQAGRYREWERNYRNTVGNGQICRPSSWGSNHSVSCVCRMYPLPADPRTYIPAEIGDETKTKRPLTHSHHLVWVMVS